MSYTQSGISQAYLALKELIRDLEGNPEAQDLTKLRTISLWFFGLLDSGKMAEQYMIVFITQAHECFTSGISSDTMWKLWFSAFNNSQIQNLRSEDGVLHYAEDTHFLSEYAAVLRERSWDAILPIGDREEMRATLRMLGTGDYFKDCNIVYDSLDYETIADGCYCHQGSYSGDDEDTESNGTAEWSDHSPSIPPPYPTETPLSRAQSPIDLAARPGEDTHETLLIDAPATAATHASAEAQTNNNLLTPIPEDGPNAMPWVSTAIAGYIPIVTGEPIDLRNSICRDWATQDALICHDVCTGIWAFRTKVHPYSVPLLNEYHSPVKVQGTVCAVYHPETSTYHWVTAMARSDAYTSGAGEDTRF